MVRVALLIGVSHYGQGFNSLPGAAKDVEALGRVLQQVDIGDFSEVQRLVDPDPTEMGTAIQTLFDGRKKEDVTLLFFSGHGIKDEQGRLYLATSKTAKDARGSLIKATAIPASFIHDLMVNSRSRQQIIILDCCFSGAFAEGLAAKDDDSVNLKDQLIGSDSHASSGEMPAGGEGRVILTSATSTQYSFEQRDAQLSVYTRYLIEGLETAAADQDNDEVISADELHEFAAKKVREAAPAMKPEIYAVKQGYKICIAKALISDPKLKYRKEAERFASHGKFSPAGRTALDQLQTELGLPRDVAQQIEADALKPHQEYRKKLQDYGRVFLNMTRPSGKIRDMDRQDLVQLQRVLKLRDEDIAPLETYILQRYYPAPVPVSESAIALSPTAEIDHTESEPNSEPHSPNATVAVIPLVETTPTQWARPSKDLTPAVAIAVTPKHRSVLKLPMKIMLIILATVGIGAGGTVLARPDLCQRLSPVICRSPEPENPRVNQAFAAVADVERLTRDARAKAEQRTDWEPSVLRKEWNAIAFRWQEACSLLDAVLVELDESDPLYVQILPKRKQCEAELAYATAMIKSITATDLAQTNGAPDRWQDILDKNQWQDIIELWQQAIASLESISADNSETYSASQRLINRYRDELSNAHQAQAYAPLRRAVAIAQEADSLQTAPPQTASDWLRIASLWDQALRELQQVDPSVPEYYEKAQGRMLPYQNNRNFAQQMASG